MANALLGLPSWGVVPHAPYVSFCYWLMSLCFPSCFIGHLAAMTQHPPEQGFVSVWSEETLWGWKHMPGEVSAHHLFFFPPLLME